MSLMCARFMAGWCATARSADLRRYGNGRRRAVLRERRRRRWSGKWNRLGERLWWWNTPGWNWRSMRAWRGRWRGMRRREWLGTWNRGERVRAESETLTGTTAVDDRRQRVRAKVNYFACVRSEAFGKDVVTCIDMSRGGLGFRTKNGYAISTEVTVAVPFSPESPEAPAIYVAARVVNIAELPELKMFRCGVAFLPVAGARANA